MDIYEDDDVEIFTSLNKKEMEKVISFANVYCKNRNLKKIKLNDELEKLNPSPIEIHYLIQYANSLHNSDPFEYINLSLFNQSEIEMMEELRVKNINIKTRILLYRCLSGTLNYRNESIYIQSIVDKAKLDIIKKIRKKSIKPAVADDVDRLKKDIDILNNKYEKLMEEKKQFGFKVEVEVRKRLRNTKNKKFQNSKIEK